ncbi:protoporphyrinogen oxidase [Paraoerskovia sediminicola]|uniref:Protoporphyrinogen oxidase n=1 Tax=Paraoerskovia sediminicola TaxID=1138587 RepID=A0ABN6XA92_9CELL|nr:FAD-dependent oxidoreductase [Paraoerskovia sediminicola]BDZ41679.1 protoporphyrinogen oxidase [Paraoerskovia sediminicola]
MTPDPDLRRPDAPRGPDAPRTTRGGKQIWDVAVVGGGVAGLAAAHRLAQRGLQVLVLESEPRCGGPVAGAELTAGEDPSNARRRSTSTGTNPRTGAAEPRPTLSVDVGAESFAARGAAVAELVAELDLEVVPPSGAAAWVRAAGDSFPLPAAGVLGIPARPWEPDVQRVIGRKGVARASLDRVRPRDDVDLSNLGTFVRSRYGKRVAQRLVAPVAAGVHSAPLDALDVDAVAPGLLAAYRETGSLGRAVESLRAAAPAGSAVRGVVGGMHTLVSALVGSVRTSGGEVRTESAVVGVSRAASGWWKVSVAGDATVRAHRLVVATPGVVEQILGTAPQRPEGTDIHLATLLLRAPEIDDAPRGTGVLVAPPKPGTQVTSSLAVLGDHEPRAKALTHSTAKWPWLAERVRRTFGEGRHVVRLSYGRLGTPTRAPSVEEALADASLLLGVDLTARDATGAGRVEAHVMTRWAGTLPPPTPAYREAVKAYVAQADPVEGLAVTGGWVAGTGLAAVVAHATAAADSLAS